MQTTILRPHVKGKFIFIGEEKFYIKGVTYGTFKPNSQAKMYPDPVTVAQDFAQMVANGINSLRTYTVPPIWVLDLAAEHNLKVMVGLPWEQHITFLDSKQQILDIKKRIIAGVRSCAEHPAILCYTIGNEIPSSIVRWYSAGRIMGFLKKIYQWVKTAAPHGLVTYVNYPSTEYLQLPFVDFVSFNLYLESKSSLEKYLARLQNLAEDKPLVMAEIGLDSLRNGEECQAKTLAWQIETIFASGCAGCFVFAWTDEWYRGGADIDDWNFGLTTRARSTKPALEKVRQAFINVPFAQKSDYPYISVAICSYNGAATIADTLEWCAKLKYPNYEVIVVDDGSTDGVAKIAAEYDVKLIVHDINRGLSAARNTALAAATGEIMAYIDDDAYPDPHWLIYLANSLLNADYAGVGGPNLPPPGDGAIADCVANAPGGPIHVLLSDSEAEHIPGCNMAFWRSHLQKIDGFDTRFRAAGDDVDICWRLQEHGWKLGFSPAAVVWHHRRNSSKAYWKQQRGYGKAEALLEAKWPEKYNSLGHLSWAGRLYGRGISQELHWYQPRIYHGSWGGALFQSVYQPTSPLYSALLTTPEWHLVILSLGIISFLGIWWQPFLFAIPGLIIALALLIGQGILSAAKASPINVYQSFGDYGRFYLITTLFYLLQPLARLWGRLENGLTPWRKRGVRKLQFFFPRKYKLWSEVWQPAEKRLASLESVLKQKGAVVLRGGDFDRWDLKIRGGLFGSLHILMAIEEHGGGKQLAKFRITPLVRLPILIFICFSIVVVVIAFKTQELAIALIFGVIVIILLWNTIYDFLIASNSYLLAMKELEERETKIIGVA